LKALASILSLVWVATALAQAGNDRRPRLPPDRAGAGLEARWQWLTADVDYLHARLLLAIASI